MILGWKISTEYKSSVMLENLRNVYSGHLPEKENPFTALLVDDGIENRGFVCSVIENREIKINKLIVQKDIRFSNSMIEAVNRRMKYDFLFRHQLLDFEHAQSFLDTAVAVEQYSNRPHTALFGLTPREVFHGANPDKNLFKDRIQHAKTVRKAENKALACHSCVFSVENQA